MIYKEAEARGIDRLFISVQIGFHGQLEGTDAARGDWHSRYSPAMHRPSPDAVFDWQTPGIRQENTQTHLEFI